MNEVYQACKALFTAVAQFREILIGIEIGREGGKERHCCRYRLSKGDSCVLGSDVRGGIKIIA